MLKALKGLATSIPTPIQCSDDYGLIGGRSRSRPLRDVLNMYIRARGRSCSHSRHRGSSLHLLLHLPMPRIQYGWLTSHIAHSMRCTNSGIPCIRRVIPRVFADAFADCMLVLASNYVFVRRRSCGDTSVERD